MAHNHNSLSQSIGFTNRPYLISMPVLCFPVVHVLPSQLQTAPGEPTEEDQGTGGCRVGSGGGG